MENIILNSNKVGDIHALYFDTLNESLDAYLEVFGSKHGLEFEQWVDCKCGVALFGDYYINFTDIIIDLEKGVEEGKFLDWYDLVMDLAAEKEPLINYETFLKLK